MKDLFQNDFQTIQLDESVPCLVYRVGRLPSSSESIREGGRNMVKFSQLYPVKSVLVVAGGSMGILFEDIEWNSLYVTPRLIEAGIKKIAIVGLDNDLVKMSVQEYMELTANAPLHQFVFKTEDEARAWLMEENVLV
jgi:hypothetical protein